MKLLASSLAILLTSFASAAQTSDSPVAIKPEKATSAPRSAGVYHVDTGTWSRTGGAAANFGPDVIYSNTAFSSYYTSVGATGGFAPGGTLVDSGLIPAVGNPDYPSADRSAYDVNCVTIGYCDYNPPGTSGWELTFYDSYDPCTPPPSADATVLVTGLPANGCWVVKLDLGATQSFCLQGDGGDGYQGNDDEDSFGWGVHYAGSDGTQRAGLYTAGDPQSTDPGWTTGATPTAGTGTYYGPNSLCIISPGVDVNTGNHSQDYTFLFDPITTYNTGCFFFGGYSNNVGCGGPSNPFAALYLELGASLDGCTSPRISTPYCQSNAASNGVQATVAVFGSTSVAADEVEVVATLPEDTFGFFLTSVDSGFVPSAGGSHGNLCLGGAIGRFQNLTASSGSAGKITISTLANQWSLTELPHPLQSYAAFPGTTSHFQLWFRQNTSGPSSNFSQGVRVTWTP